MNLCNFYVHFLEIILKFLLRTVSVQIEKYCLIGKFINVVITTLGFHVINLIIKTPGTDKCDIKIPLAG